MLRLFNRKHKVVVLVEPPLVAKIQGIRLKSICN